MKLTQSIANYKIIITEKHIGDRDTFFIEAVPGDENTFYVYSSGGFSTADFKYFEDIESALKFLKKEVIKPWFESRGMDNPKGF